MIDYCFLLRMNHPKNLLSFIVGGIFIITLILTVWLKTYSSYQTVGIYQDYLIISVPIKNSDAVKKGEYLKINNQKHKYHISSISEIKFVDQQNYQDYYLKINKDFITNELVEVTFYYEEERIIQKIIKIIF